MLYLFLPFLSFYSFSHTSQCHATKKVQSTSAIQKFIQFCAEKREQQQQRLPLRAFKKIGRVGTLPALAHSQNPGGIQQAMAAQSPGLDDLPLGSAMSSSSRATGSAFQRWTGLPGHRRGSHLGWDSARPQSAARLQQQMLEKIYTKNELKVQI
jgi:hypothetical protein